MTFVEISVLALLHSRGVEVLRSATCNPVTLEGVCTVRAGRLERSFRGKLLHRGANLIWRADVEDAVAAIVASESEPGALPAALEAQAIVARGFLLAGTRHKGFDFCDTTHCQHFKQATPESIRAAKATAGLVLTWNGAPFAPAYSASCGGRTRTAHQVGWNDDGSYPYFEVACPVCQRQEPVWTRPLPGALDPERNLDAQRIRAGRSLGWAALPSNNYSVEGAVAVGRGRGHGVGFCQRGAAGMAREGFTAAAILAHYFPATAVARR